MNRLYAVSRGLLAALLFPLFLQSQSGADKWDLHNEYEKVLVKRCAAEIGPAWEERLADTRTYLKSPTIARERAEIVQGTLDMLILRTLQ